MLLLAVLVSCLRCAFAWNISLEVTVQASGARGGEPFDAQPRLSVFDRGGGTLQSTFLGRATVAVEESPPRAHVPIRAEGGVGGDEGAHAPPSDAPVSRDVEDGRVRFEGLRIDPAGTYRLRFVLYDEHDLLMYSVLGDELQVEVGDAHQIGVARQPESAYGGSEFGSQPIVALRDRGGNTVFGANEGAVTVSMETGGYQDTLRCAEGREFTVSFENGLASFQGLYINAASLHYSLRFSTDLALEGQTEIVSNVFTVGAGAASQLTLAHDVAGEAFEGGEAFVSQPRVEVKDKGGNVLVDDSSSAIRVTFYSNPSRGELLPSSQTLLTLQAGVAQFSNLSIDKAGVGYRLSYEFLQFEDAHVELKETTISVLGEYFDVSVGPPRALTVLKHSARAWAGNQPFSDQPRIALVDAGGNVVKWESASSVTAQLKGGSEQILLDGDTAVQVTEGVAVFRDLAISERGEYEILYQSDIASDLHVTEFVEVDAAIEYEVRGDLHDRDPGDMHGDSVTIHGDLLAVGAPGKRTPLPEVQVLTVYSKTSTDKSEVQIISTSLDREGAMRSTYEFGTCADPGETISGKFALSFKEDTYSFARPILFDSGISAEQMQTTLEQSLNLVGRLSVARNDDPGCESLNAWRWEITFLDTTGAESFSADDHSLIGAGAVITSPTNTREVDLLRGSYEIINPFNKQTSRPLAYNASGSDVKTAIEDDLGITVRIVQSENTYLADPIPELGRRWTIIFEHHATNYGVDVNVPQLQVRSASLLGSEAAVVSHTAFEGRSQLRGSFALSFRGSDLSTFIPHDCSPADLASALESLDSINEVTVSGRRHFTDEAGKSGFSWTITFDSVNKLTDYGWIPDPRGASSGGNLEPLKVESHLVGWNVGHIVDAETGRGSDDTQAQWMAKEKGDEGSNSGVVYIYGRVGSSWRKEAIVRAHDYNSNDFFGASLSMTSDQLLVGAPSKEVSGLPEQQILTCRGPATGGAFTVGFRGFYSDLIQHNATLLDIRHALIGLYGETSRLHTLPRLIISAHSDGIWDGTSDFCGGEGNSISITFLTPDGGGISTDELHSGNLELLAVDSARLVDAIVYVSEARAGTKAPMGNDLRNAHPTEKESGSAYLYQRSLPCILCDPVWTQVMKFTPLNGLDDPTDAAEFGRSAIAVHGTTWLASTVVIIGSPGYNFQSGKVYIFHQYETSWSMLDTLTDMNWNHGGEIGGRFGHSIASDGETILVGAPEYKGKGAVFVFRRSQAGKQYLASQAIFDPEGLEADRFGHSLSLFGNKVVICAPGKATEAVHLPLRQAAKGRTGSCLVYEREDDMSSFTLEQQLVPSNLLTEDRFGWSVDMSKDMILVGQIERSNTQLGPPRPVQVVKTFCISPPCSDAAMSRFRLQWADRKSPETAYLPASATANEIKDAIESNLVSGSVSVSRSKQTDVNGGHTWRITFDEYTRLALNVYIPMLVCDVFVTSSLACEVTVEQSFPNQIRGKAHIFEFDGDGRWTEQAFLYPHAPQNQDLFGTSVALDGEFAVVGSPNREQLNVNAGAALIYGVGFLDLRFADSTAVSVLEGQSITVTVQRSQTNGTQAVSFRTVDRNADADLQNYIKDIYSLRPSQMETPADVLTGSSAFGRSHFYGSDERRSRFVNGRYDGQAFSDYALLNFETVLASGETFASANLEATDDAIVENPDETLSIMVNLKGMFPSSFGRHKIDLVIRDNQDGTSPDGIAMSQILTSPEEDARRYGSVIAVDRSAAIMAVGRQHASGHDSEGNRVSNAGSVDIFKQSESTKRWELIATLSAPSDILKPNLNYGSGIAVHKLYGRDELYLLVGASGGAISIIYRLDTINLDWTEEAILRPDEALTSEHDFGTRHGVALVEDVAFVACAPREVVFVYRRRYDGGTSHWDLYQKLHSSDYEYSVIYDHGRSVDIHRHGFGTAVAVSGRILLVSSPFFQSNSMLRGLGEGKVYSFFSQPHVQLITLTADEIITDGSFQLVLPGQQLGLHDQISGMIQHDSSPDMLKFALEQITTLGRVEVEAHESFAADKYQRSWRVTFQSVFQDSIPTLEPVWFQNGCDECEEFRVSVLSEVEPFLTIESLHTHGQYSEESDFQPPAVSGSDLCGLSIAVDGPEAIVGCPGSSARPRTTWDFETGDLRGWSAEGAAFSGQPTFEDPSGRTQSNLQGWYYAGTCEGVPGQTDMRGHAQGDDNTGTLTSDPFVILEDTISLLVGGGCNHLTSYVELLVDSHPVLRATGACRGRMERVVWDVSQFVNRSGIIRAADRVESMWGCIGVDDVVTSASGKNCFHDDFGTCGNSEQDESHEAGASFVFHRDCEPRDVADARPSNTNCTWTVQERLVASDKRAGDNFGSSVDINHEAGIAVVGSPRSEALGGNSEPVYVHPFSGDDATALPPVPPHMEDFMKAGDTRSRIPSNLRLVANMLDRSVLDEGERYARDAGSAYVFARAPATLDRRGKVDRRGYWRPTELARLSPSSAGDNFGSTVVLGDDDVLAGAPGRLLGEGAVHAHESRWTGVKFSSVEYVALERGRSAKILVGRDLRRSRGGYSVAYSVSDLSAVGVDPAKFEECERVPSDEREGCGDYEQASGVLTFEPDQEEAYFVVRVVDDRCTESFMEYAQINLHVVGGSLLEGENYRAVLRIDDDDWGEHSHRSRNCSDAIK